MYGGITKRFQPLKQYGGHFKFSNGFTTKVTYCLQNIVKISWFNKGWLYRCAVCSAVDCSHALQRALQRVGTLEGHSTGGVDLAEEFGDTSDRFALKQRNVVP